MLRETLADVLGCGPDVAAGFRADTPLWGARAELDPFAAAGLVGELETRLQIDIDEPELGSGMLGTFGSLSCFLHDQVERSGDRPRNPALAQAEARSSAKIVFAMEEPRPDQLKQWWLDLERRAKPRFFLSWLWIGTWIEQTGDPHHVLVGRQDGRIVCLGLLRRGVEWRHRALRSRTIYLHETGKAEEDILFIEHNNFLCDPDAGALVPQAIAFLRLDPALGRFDEIQLGGIPEATFEELRDSGLKVHLVARKPTALVDLRSLRETGTAYLDRLSSNTRYQIKRAVKMYEKRGPVTVEPARTTEEALEFFDALGVLHEAGWQQRGSSGAWSHPFLVKFHRRLIETAFPHGGIDIVRISCGGTPIGYIHCLVRDGWFGSYLSGFAYEEDNKLKPGLVSFYKYVEHRLTEGGETIDFLAGDQRYKTSLGEAGPAMCWLRVQEARPHLLIEQGLRLAKHRLQSLRPTRAAGGLTDEGLQAA